MPQRDRSRPALVKAWPGGMAGIRSLADRGWRPGGKFLRTALRIGRGSGRAGRREKRPRSGRLTDCRLAQDPADQPPGTP